jgi:hypothetical protein
VGGQPVEGLRYQPPTLGSHKLERDAEGRPIGRSRPWPASPPPARPVVLLPDSE